MALTPDLTTCLHICSNSSAGGNIKQMLKHVTGQRSLPVIISEMLENTGPLDLLNKPEKRLEWFRSIGFDLPVYLACDDTGELVARWQAFWTRIDT